MENSTLRVVVCDDEPIGRQVLAQQVQELGFECVGEASNGFEAIELVKNTKPDVILLDVCMPEMDGLDCAHSLADLQSPPAIIFVSAFDTYAIEAFKSEAVGYILKPCDINELNHALKRAERLSKIQLSGLQPKVENSSFRQNLTARTHKGIELIPLDGIYYFLADQKYVTVRHVKGEVLIDETLKDLEKEFGDRFMRIHRNALISLTYLEGLELMVTGQYQVKLKGIDDRLLVSRRHLSELKERMTEL